MSLLPEKPMAFSPQLASALGLEEAVMLQVLQEAMAHNTATERNGFMWLELDGERLLSLVPFWNDRDVQRISASLREKGVLLIGSAPFQADRALKFAFNQSGVSKKDVSQRQRADSQRTSSQGTAGRRSANLISSRWQPERDVLAQLEQYGVPRSFSQEQVGEFVTYWSERGEPQHSWGSKFIKQVLRLWRDRESERGRRQREIPMDNGWRPSSDAMEILTRQAGISQNFVEDAIPEFVLYWGERGNRSSTWNAQFVRHVKHQWARYTATLERDTEPRPITRDWRPGGDMYEVLQLANIPRKFAEQLIPEFVLFWRENGQAHNSWNTKFLQHVKRQWARHCEQQQGDSNERRKFSDQPVSTRARSLVEDLTDRSWAS